MKHLKFFVFLCILTFTVSCSQQKKYVQYKVKEGETMRSIANRLDMKTRDLLRLNPDFDRKPEANSVIVIPNKKFKIATDSQKEKSVSDVVTNDSQLKEALKEENDALLNELKKNFVVYEVKKGDTFYSLTRFYNVSQEKMITFNPELSEGLKVGQIIKIKPIEEGKVPENSIYEDFIAEEVSLKAALLLPFKTSENDTIASNELFTKSRLANIVTDFYLGAEIALDSLRKQGVSIELNVFDTERNSTKLDTILLINDLNKNDVVIGPLYSEEAETLANSIKVPIIFPFYSKNQSKFSETNLVKTSPEKNVFREQLISYLKDSISNQNLILVSDGDFLSETSSTFIKSSLEEHDSISIVHIVKPKDGYIARERFTDVFKPDVFNWVVMATDDNVIIADAINSVNSLSDSLSMRIFSYNKGVGYDKIDNFKLAKLNYTYVSDEFVDETSASTQLFNSQYYRKNNALPSFYATKGFDITYDVLIRLASGDDLRSTFKDGASYRVESKFDYSNKLFGGSENKGLFIVQYNKDLTLTRLK